MGNAHSDTVGGAMCMRTRNPATPPGAASPRTSRAPTPTPIDPSDFMCMGPNAFCMRKRPHGDPDSAGMESWRMQGRAELHVYREQLFGACRSLTPRSSPDQRSLLISCVLQVAFILPEIVFDADEAQQIIAGEKRDTAREVRESPMLLSRLDSLRSSGRDVISSPDLRHTLSGCCVRAMVMSPDKSKSAKQATKFAILHVGQVSQVSNGFTILEFQVLHRYADSGTSPSSFEL
jgi:hypothetical protein